MNLRVDLILESEQRSGSLLSPKSLIRIAIVIFPSILALLLAVAAYKTWHVRDGCRQLEERLRITSDRKTEAVALREMLAVNEGIVKKLKWWHDTQLDWAKQLLGLRDVVPATVQLRTLSINQKVNTAPARVFTMVLGGRAEGPGAEADVRNFARQIEKLPRFKDLLESSKVTSFRKDISAKAGPEDRVFEIECRFKPRT